jgi:hypothetical protein
MMKLLRFFAYAGLIYGGYLVAFPDWDGQVYHVASLAVIAGAAVGLFILHKIADITSAGIKIVTEVAFVFAVAGWFGYTMPTKSGKTPWELWNSGHRPGQSDARQGLSRLGVDPNGAAGSALIGLFPR